jgi:hypothetical protein
MAGRNVTIERNETLESNQVKVVESAGVRVERLHNAQTGTRFKLTITSDDIETLVKVLDNEKLAVGIVSAFTMREAPTIATLRPFLPNFNVHFPKRKHRS